MPQGLKSKKGTLFFYINSGKLETTLTPTLPTLDYTGLPFLRHLTYLWLCPSFGFSSLLQLSLLLWVSFPEALQSCLADIPALNSICYYITLCSTFSVSTSPLSITQKFNVPVAMSQLWILHAVLPQLVVVAIFL